MKVVSLSPPRPSFQPFVLPVACFRFSNLSETKHREMCLRFSHSDIFCLRKANTATIMFSGLASHYFSHVVLLQKKNVTRKTVLIRENTCQKFYSAYPLRSDALLVHYVRTCAKKEQLATSISLDELDVCANLDMGNVVRRGTVIQCGKK